MELIDKIPQMTDDALQTLATNARRLMETGTAAQQSSASSLLPAIDAEITTRRSKKLEEMRTRAVAARAAKDSARVASGAAAPAKRRRAAKPSPDATAKEI